MARTPLYRKAEEEMRRRIAEGDWPVGMRLGNEFQLADEFKVSQGTMRRALITLESEGLLSRKPGRGTLVSEPSAAPASASAPSGQLVGPKGAVVFEVHRARQSTRRPNAEEIPVFGQEKLHHVERLLKLGGARAALEELVVASEVVSEFDEYSSPDLAEALTDHGVSGAVIEDSLSADLTSMGDSVALSCDRNTALLCITRTARLPGGQAIARQVLRIAEPGVSYG
ncbi:MAG: GntR family transcriptional regulator [Pseudomonadota bacterium]